jgi:multiple sugar transport system ATP-binding protein
VIPSVYRESLQSAGEKVIAGFRPEHLELGEIPAPFATIQGTADVVEYLGNEELLHVTVAGRDIVAIVDSSHRVRPGDVVQLRLPADKLQLFNAETGVSLAQSREAAAVA